MGTRTRVMAFAAAVMAIAMAGCGGTDESSGSTSTTVADVTTTTAQATTTTAARPTYRILSEAELTSALLDVQALPPGYSQDPPADQGRNKTFCDYKPPFTESTRVRRDFTEL